MTLVLGVDAGGTKTLLAVADQHGRVLRLLRRDSIDPLASTDWRARLGVMVAEITDGLSAPLGAAALGLPFHGEIPAVSTAQRDAACAMFRFDPIVENDVRIAFDGAFAGGAGVLVLAGTGSMAWAGLNMLAPHRRAGGWGDLFGDEGSAYWIGREALGLASRQLDGRLPDQGFGRALLAHLDLGAEDLIGWCYSQENPRRAIASLAEFVAQRGRVGDPSALDLLSRAGDYLAEAALAAWAQTGAARGDLRWSAAGGVMQNQIVLDRIARKLEQPAQPAVLPPIGGALLRAAGRLYGAIDPAWIAVLSSELAEADA